MNVIEADPDMQMVQVKQKGIKPISPDKHHQTAPLPHEFYQANSTCHLPPAHA